MSTPSPRPDLGAVVGAGPIGVSWALTLARAGLQVRLHDVDTVTLEQARHALGRRLHRLHESGLLDEQVDLVGARVRYVRDLGEAVAGATHVQECVAELRTTKRELLQSLDGLLAPDAVVASSSSAIPTSQVADDLPWRERCLVVHPANPPHLLPVVEVVPAPFTSTDTVARTRRLLTTIGMRPVVLSREVEGFVMNRLQGSLLREAYCLVRDGVVSVDDLDAVVRDGIGRRWAVSGPFETADLNTVGGVRAHAARMAAAYWRMGAERGQDDPWTDELVDEVTRQRRQLLPLEAWESRNTWREDRLMELTALLEGPLPPSPTALAPAHDARV